MDVAPPPSDLQETFEVVFNGETRRFIEDVHRQFKDRIDREIVLRRIRERETFASNKNKKPKFAESAARNDPNWKIAALPSPLKDLRLIIGDMSPWDRSRFELCLKSDEAKAIQVDFDDGHCPSWRKQLMSWFNIREAVRGHLGRPLKESPILLIRPRAWNMIDSKVFVDGEAVHGSIVDFAIHLCHNGRLMHEAVRGPWLFLSKTESAVEAKLWDDIFTWTEKRLELPHGCIKAHVLIENVLASFELEEILFNLKDHSLGLNCGIWDYAASFISLFGDRDDFLIPDRSLYVNMEKHFLKSYLNLVVHTSHKRGAPATGGMAAILLPPNEPKSWPKIIDKVTSGKSREIDSGVDGFLYYDLDLAKPLSALWASKLPNATQQLRRGLDDPRVTSEDLLKIPSGGVTIMGLVNNVNVGIRFIYSWIRKAEGHFAFNGQVEDSATAEISRSQVWQWLKHGVRLEDEPDTIVTKTLIEKLINDFLSKCSEDKESWNTAANAFNTIVTAKYFPLFITTFLYDETCFNMKN